MPIAAPILSIDRALLAGKAVRLTPLDDRGKPIPHGAGIKTASGFIRQEANGQLFLYACWHTVTGLDRNTRALPPPTHIFPRRLLVQLKGVETAAEGIQRIGGLRTFELELYDSHGAPAWMQDCQYIANADLENVGLRFPFLHDAVKLDVTAHKPFPFEQLNTARLPNEAILMCGEKVLLIGFPHGYSALHTPTPLVLTAHVAATRIEDRMSEFLVDRPGAPGMSGGPVYLDRDNHFYLVGIYTGIVKATHDATVAAQFGTCAFMVTAWAAAGRSLVPANSGAMQAVEPLAADLR